MKKKLLISRGKLFFRFFRFFKAVWTVKLHDDLYLAFLISLFICYMIVSCRHSATTKEYDNGTSKDYGGNEIKPAGSNTISLKVAIIVLSVLILVLCGIIIYIERKRRRGSYFIWNSIIAL